MSTQHAPPLPFAYFHQKIVPIQEATISIASHSLQYGTICIGGIRGYVRGKEIRLLRLQDHFIRLQNSVKILGMEIALDWESFRSTIIELVKKNAPTADFYIRPMLYSENQELVPRFYGLKIEMAIYALPLSHYFDPTRGLEMMISSWVKTTDNMVSSKAKAGGGYLNSAMAKTEAKKCGYDEALMMDATGHIVEASVANIFIVYRDQVIMPPTGDALLEGITRRTVIELLKEEGTPAVAESIDRSMVYTCSELLVTGTAAQITYAQSVDGRVIGLGNTPGPFCQRLRQRFADIIEMRHPKSSEWLTLVQL